MSLKKFKTRVLPQISQEGVVTQAPTQIFISTDDPVEFHIVLPDYVQHALNLSGDAKSPALEHAVQIYTGIVQAYLMWLRNTKAVPMLLIEAKYKAFLRGQPAAVRNDFGLHSKAPVVSLVFDKVFQVGKHLHRQHDGKVGERFYPDRDTVLLPYSQELEERLTILCASLTRSIYQLDALLQGDVEAKLMAGPAVLSLT